MKPLLFPEIKNINERTGRSVKIFHEIAIGIHTYNWEVAFLSGFAIDAHFGYLTKDHKDVDLIISKKESEELSTYLKSLGHHVYEVDKFKGEVLKVDQADKNKDTQSHCDIHYFWEEENKIVIPLLGKKLVIGATFKDAIEECNFLGQKIKVLRPKYLLEEKVGWCEQIGLSQCREKPELYKADIEKITYLISLNR